MKFNIGDRVQSILTKRRGTVRGISGCLVAVELDDQTSGVPIPKFGIANGLFLMEEDYEKISTNKILITSDGKTTLARLYDGEKVTRSAETKCSPTDTYDFATGANLAYDRLMRPTSVEPQDKPKFKAGDKAKVIANTCGHHMRTGDIVTLTDNMHVNASVADLPAWHYKERSPGFISERDMEPYTELKPEPAKLYCVKSFEPGEWLTRGKIYELSGGGTVFDDGYECSGYDSLDAFFSKNNMWRDNLVPLVSRPAKVGEWVLPLADCPFGRYKKNQPLKVTKDLSNKPDSNFFNRGVVYEHPDCNAYVIRNDEYLTLDGYDGRYEPQEPKYWSGKVVCVKKANDFLTAGKVYTFKNGKSSDDNGATLPCFGYIRSIEHLNEELWSDFIESKGEAT